MRSHGGTLELLAVLVEVLGEAGLGGNAPGGLEGSEPLDLALTPVAKATRATKRLAHGLPAEAKLSPRAMRKEDHEEREEEEDEPRHDWLRCSQRKTMNRERRVGGGYL